MCGDVAKFSDVLCEVGLSWGKVCRLGMDAVLSLEQSNVLKMASLIKVKRLGEELVINDGLAMTGSASHANPFLAGLFIALGKAM